MARKRGGRVMREAAPDFGTPELHRRHLVVIEDGGAAWDKPHARVIDQRPLDRYLARGELSPNPAIASAMFEAGHRLRTDWTIAGLEPKVIAQLSPRSQAQLEFSERRIQAIGRKDRALMALSPLHRSVAIAVVCQDMSAQAWAKREGVRPWLQATAGIGALRLALGALARFYGPAS